MSRTLLNMLAKCIDEDQTNWSVKLPYVLMAYRSFVHVSTGFTPHYLVFGHEVSLPLDLMYRPPPGTTPLDVNDWVSQKEQAFRQAYQLVRCNATTQQRRRNNLYNKRVHGPTYKEGEYVLLHYLVVPVRESPKSMLAGERNNRSPRAIGLIAAAAGAAGLILGDPLKDAACSVLSIFS